MNDLFRLRGTLPAPTALTAKVVGAAAAVALWHLVVVTLGLVKPTILPPPLAVFKAFGDLFQQGLVVHAWVSVKLNLLGYLYALLISLPLGFALGLIPLFRALSEDLMPVLRYLPLPATMGIFINAFGISTGMKTAFLAVGIAVYLLPTVVTRVVETPEVYVQTARTLGAKPWQIVQKVFVPSVLSRVYDDIRILTAISWTYITIAEATNAGEGGLGALANNSWRAGQTQKIYAVLIVIMALGWLQDWGLRRLGPVFFRHKQGRHK